MAVIREDYQVSTPVNIELPIQNLFLPHVITLKTIRYVGPSLDILFIAHVDQSSQQVLGQFSGVPGLNTINPVHFTTPECRTPTVLNVNVSTSLFPVESRSPSPVDGLANLVIELMSHQAPSLDYIAMFVGAYAFATIAPPEAAFGEINVAFA